MAADLGPVGPGPAGGGSIPFAFVASVTPFATSSATFVDITGATVSITIPSTAIISAWTGIAWSGASSVVAEFRVDIDGQMGDATSSDAANASADVTVPVLFASTPLAAATYVVKVQARKVSGSGSLTVSHCDLTALATISVTPLAPRPRVC